MKIVTVWRENTECRIGSKYDVAVEAKRNPAGRKSPSISFALITKIFVVITKGTTQSETPKLKTKSIIHNS
ncbi:MAG: hypothetical protein K8R63_10940 [Bacteroidales bacterium]|nr:hypothetical protein [Bacteroidales bacterium]